MDDFIGTELQKFKMSDAVIAKMNEEFLALTVKDITDKAGYTAVKAARLEVKGKRVEVEKTRKALKAESLAFGRAVDGEAKRLTALLQPIEDHLALEQAAVDEAIAKAKLEEKARQQLPMRKERLELEGLTVPDAELLQMTIEDFEAGLFRLKQDRVEAKALEQAKEAEALAAEREKIDAEKAKLVQDKQHADDIEAAKKQAREDERQAAEQAGKAKIEQERKAREEQAQFEASRPDRESILAYLDKLQEVPAPAVQDPALAKVWLAFTDAFDINIVNMRTTIKGD